MKKNTTTRIWILAAGLATTLAIIPPSMEAGMGKLWPFASKNTLRSKSIPLAEGYRN